MAMPGGDALRVTHVVLSLDVGGLERVVLDLVRRGRSLGQRPAVICLERRGELAGDAEAAGAEVICLGKPPGIRPEVVGRIAVALRGLGPGAIHTHQIAALFYAGPAARLLGSRSIVHTEHGDHLARCVGPSARARARLLRAIAGRQAARFVCVSGAIAESVMQLGAVPRRRVSVVPNGIDTSAGPGPGAAGRAEALGTLGLGPSGPVIGTLGRLAEVKRQDVLIRGFARILPAHPGARLVLIGEGPERPALLELARSLGLGDRVHLAGYRADPERLLATLDAFALTSRSEGMPLAILEAWSAGVPVVASRVGGIPALVRDGVDGLLFEPGDVDGLASRLLGLLGDPALARRIGRAGRSRATSEFDSSIMASAYDRLYREAMAARVPGAGA